MPNEDWIDRLPSGLREHVRGLSNLPDFARHLARFSEVLHLERAKGDPAANELAERARRLAPDDPLVRLSTEWCFRRRVPRWHFGIVNDSARNEIYRAALHRHVRPGMTVFEVGTGTGVLAMLAAQAGAAHVYTCEREPLLAEVARDNIARNGLADRITVIAKQSSAVLLGVDLPRRADLFVAELVDDMLLGEHVLAITRDVRTRLLVPGAILLPDQIELRGTLVGGPAWAGGFRGQQVAGLDVSALDRFAPPRLRAPDGVAPDLAKDVTALRFDLTGGGDFQAGPSTLEVTAMRDGVADGFLHWIWLGFGAGLELTNRPPVKSCWAPQIHTFPRALAVTRGESLRLQIQHDGESVRIWPSAPPVQRG